jgi:hypothetical protein
MLSSLARGFLGETSDKDIIKVDPIWGFAEFPAPGDTKKHTLPIFVDPEDMPPKLIIPEKNEAKKSNSNQLRCS